jgi:uncharacterized membrane protein
MSDEDSKTIIWLLWAILFVLLFGAGAFIHTLWWVAGIGLVVGIVGFVWSAIRSVGETVAEEMREAKGEPRIATTVGLTGAALNFVVLIWAGVIASKQGIRFSDALSEVPLYWMPVLMILGAYPVQWALSIQSWGPSFPRTVLNGIRGVSRSVRDAFVAPVEVPLERIRLLRWQRENGEPVNTAATLLRTGALTAYATLIWLMAFAVPVVTVALFVIGIRNGW